MYLSERTALRLPLNLREYNIFPTELLSKKLQDIGDFDLKKPASDQIYQKIEDVINFYKIKLDEQFGQKWACNFIIVKDMENFLSCLKLIGIETDIDKRIPKLNDQIIEHIRDFWGLEYDDPYQIYIDDDFPEYFKKYDWAAANVKPHHPSGLSKGIYLARRTMSEYTRILLYHEHIHTSTIPKDNDFHFILWFDEGISEILPHIFDAENNCDWERWLNYRLRAENFTSKTETLIRKWNANMISKILVYYGIDFLKYLIRVRSTSPSNINWLKLYNSIKNCDNPDKIKNCFTNKIPNEVFENKTPEIYSRICKINLAYERPVTISPLAYVLLKIFIDKAPKSSSFDELSFDDIKKELESKVGINELKKAGKELNSLLSIGTTEDNGGLRAWDTIGYYKDTLNFNFMKAYINDSMF